MLLTSPTPAEFFNTHLADRQARHDDEIDRSHAPTVWRTLDELLDDDARLLRESHARAVADGDPPNAVANYLVGWIGGFLGEVVGFVHATTGAGVLADSTVRWRFRPEGWPDRVDVTGARIAVPDDHPWAGVRGVETLRDAAAVRLHAVESLVATLAPLVDACRTLAKVGRNALWAEVADGIGTATAASPGLDGSVATIADVEALLAVPGAPWRQRPTLWAAVGDSGPMVVGRKGGCCLAYTGLEDEPDNAEGVEDLDPEQRAYKERFPRVTGERYYCSTCCFRDAADVEARQVYWADLLAAKTARVARGARMRKTAIAAGLLVLTACGGGGESAPTASAPTDSPLYDQLPAVQDDSVLAVPNRPWYFPTILGAEQILADVQQSLIS